MRLMVSGGGPMRLGMCHDLRRFACAACTAAESVVFRRFACRAILLPRRPSGYGHPTAMET